MVVLNVMLVNIQNVNVIEKLHNRLFGLLAYSKYSSGLFDNFSSFPITAHP